MVEVIGIKNAVIQGMGVGKGKKIGKEGRSYRE
jgi:hypothetical protein